MIIPKHIRNIKSLCHAKGTNIVLQINYTSEINKSINTLTGNKIRFVTTSRMMGEGELDGSSQKVQPSSHKYQGHNISDVMYNMKNIINFFNN